MLLIAAKVHRFMSINEVQDVQVDSTVTVLVGMNEAGKTVFLRALEKSNDAVELAKFDVISDYPRKDLSGYQRKHKDAPALVTELTYKLDNKEVDQLNAGLHTKLEHGFTFSCNRDYNGKESITIEIEEDSAAAQITTSFPWSTDARAAIANTKSIREISLLLKAANLTDADKAQLSTIEARVAKTNWDKVIEAEVWAWIKPRIPKFLYFSDYDLLPSKVNLADLATRTEQAKTDPKQLTAAHRATLALLRMADISIQEITKTGGYESLKAKIEGVSISLTDQIMAVSYTHLTLPTIYSV